MMNTILTTFGRFQPFTIGHYKLIKSMIDYAKINKIDFSICLSKTQDKKRNPLNYERKLYWIHEIFPFIHILEDKNVNSPIAVLEYFNEKYSNIIFYTGEDRKEEFTILFNKYNHVNYDYNSIIVKSVGKRNQSSKDSIESVSSSIVRNYIKEDNFEMFCKNIPNLTIYQKIKLFKELQNVLL